jgi:FkbM family methyltransferase
VLLAASLTLPNGDPRFHLGFPKEFAADPGAKCLVANEFRNGYELPTRNLLERAIRPGDLFVDVGAHWGFFTLQAATHPARDATVVGFEPDPANAAILIKNVADNGLTDKVSVVCAACGDDFEIAPLVANSTMMHSIRGVGLKPPFARGPSKWVPVVTLDRALVAFPRAASARIILKIDAEGFEPQVLAGAKSLLQAGRVAIIVWEYGPAFADGLERDAMRQMVGALDDLGFRHSRPPSPGDRRAARPVRHRRNLCRKRHFALCRCRDVTLQNAQLICPSSGDSVEFCAMSLRAMASRDQKSRARKI